MVEIMETLDEAESDDSVRSVIFTGSGRAYLLVLIFLREKKRSIGQKEIQKLMELQEILAECSL